MGAQVIPFLFSFQLAFKSKMKLFKKSILVDKNKFNEETHLIQF